MNHSNQSVNGFRLIGTSNSDDLSLQAPTKQNEIDPSERFRHTDFLRSKCRASKPMNRVIMLYCQYCQYNKVDWIIDERNDRPLSYIG